MVAFSTVANSNKNTQSKSATALVASSAMRIGSLMTRLYHWRAQNAATFTVIFTKGGFETARYVAEPLAPANCEVFGGR